MHTSNLVALAALSLSCLAAPIAAQRLVSAAPTGHAEPNVSDTGVSWDFLRPSNTGIPGDYVHKIYLDDNDQPWITGYIPFWEQGGMAHWDGSHWLTVSSDDYPEIVSPRFNDIVSDATGALWIGTDAGLLYYDPAIGPESLVRYDRNNSPFAPSKIVSMDIDPDGVLWLALRDWNSSPSGGLAAFDPSAGTWNVWTTANGLPWATQWPGWDWVEFVGVIPNPVDGFTVWFGSGPMGMATYEDGQFSWFGNNFTPTGPTVPVGLSSKDPVDRQGNAWMMTNKGLARRAIDGTYTVVGYPAGLSTEVSVVVGLDGGRAALGTYYADVFLWDNGWSYLGNWGSGNHTYTIVEDSTGALWAGGIGGASKYENGSWQRYRLTNTGMVGHFMSTIDFGADGVVYMNGNAAPGVGGFSMFDGTDWVCVNDANYGLGPAWGLPSDDVEALLVRRNGDVALAPSGGQGLLNWDGASYTYVIPQGYTIMHVAEDGLDRLWGARPYGWGLFLVDGQNSVQFTPQNSPLPSGDIESIEPEEGMPGFVWVTTRFGMALTDGLTWQVYPRELLGLTQNSTGWLLTDAARTGDGKMWVGSGRGLYLFDLSSETYTRYTTANSGLPSDEISHIEVAPDGSVWVATFDFTFPYPGGLTHFDGETWTTYTASESPLPHNQIDALATRPSDGGYEVWVGTASEAVAVVRVRAPRGDDGFGPN